MLHVASMRERFFDQRLATLLSDNTRTCEMRYKWTNVRVVLTLCMALPMLGGCLDSTNDRAESSTVAPPTGGSNSAPTISGTPPTAIKISELYSFAPSASDANGDNLTFSIQNMPRWASFVNRGSYKSSLRYVGPGPKYDLPTFGTR